MDIGDIPASLASVASVAIPFSSSIFINTLQPHHHFEPVMKIPPILDILSKLVYGMLIWKQHDCTKDVLSCI